MEYTLQLTDEIALQKDCLLYTSIREFIPVKTASTSTVYLQETFEYTVTLENTCDNPLTDVFFQDLIPQGLSFVPGSVIVNGISQPTLQPNTGFALPNVAPHSSVVAVSYTHLDVYKRQGDTGDWHYSMCI